MLKKKKTNHIPTLRISTGYRNKQSLDNNISFILNQIRTFYRAKYTKYNNLLDRIKGQCIIRAYIY